jgi:hypothetical protein
MAGRTRTTKKLAQRINQNYFKNRFPLTQWRFRLSLGLTAIGLLWLAWHAFARSPKVYSSGAIASSHAVFGDNCGACHVNRGALTKAVTDQACESCHDGPIHQAQQTAMPACSECHVEHQGRLSLARTSDQACTRCHSNLTTKNGVLTVAAHVRSFNSDHPEFAPLRAGQTDPGTVKFNHQVHLKKQLRGPNGNVDLRCSDCHRSGLASATPQPHTRLSNSAYMEPVNYEKDCSSCHPLQFDRRIDQPAPHKKPEIVHEFVIAKLREYIGAHPGDISIPDETDGRIPPRMPVMPARNADEWVARRVVQAEQLLWGKTCKECHSLTFSASDPVPEVPKAIITARWLMNGEFDHQAHQMVLCVDCHTKAPSSQKTADILLPSIQVCRSCHHPGEQAARSSCDECHQYHDWTKEKRVEPKYSIHDLISAVPPSKKEGSGE